MPTFLRHLRRVAHRLQQLPGLVAAIALLCGLQSARASDQVTLPSHMPAAADAGAFHSTLRSLAGQLRAEPAIAESVSVALLMDNPAEAIRRAQAAKDNRSAANDSARQAKAWYAHARQVQPEAASEVFSARFERYIKRSSPQAAHAIAHLDTYDLNRDRLFIDSLLAQLPASGIDPAFAEANYRWSLLRLVQVYADFHVMSALLPLVRPLIEQDRARRYHIETDVLIETSDGVTLSAMVVRPRDLPAKSPAILFATIYADHRSNLRSAVEAAAHGYVGVVSDSRGKRLGTGTITPYENESTDVHAVIEWISRQAWSDGRVGMYGGSYVGYTQWAATRSMHPALKTIVPAVAAMPGQGLPMENNVFLSANYPWSAFVTTGKMNHDEAYNMDWRGATRQWFETGRPYRELDQLAGQPNPWLQKWLDHPAFDDYWQSMIPTAEDYGLLDIPVLSITGYYDDGQISALQYLQDHYRHNPDAHHYLIIGPYDHFSAQVSPASSLRNYDLDPSALIDVTKITFDWFDHVLRGAERPKILRDRINYQLPGDDSWRSAASLDVLRENTKKFFLSAETSGAYRLLAANEPSEADVSRLTVDLADRSKTHNNHYYPYPIVKEALRIDSGLAFVTEPLENDMELAGILEGQLDVRINKRDFDLGLVLFEITPENEFFHLTYVLGRASFADDPTQRNLLEPGKMESIPVPRSRMFARKLEAGSRLLLLVDVNVNALAQVNYGTGKDVSDESIEDAGDPLQIEWINSSYIRLPLRSL